MVFLHYIFIRLLVDKKIAERRHLNRISRDLEGFFQDASDLEMRRASAAGDVCGMLMLKYKYPKSFLISFYFPIVCGMHNKLLK